MLSRLVITFLPRSKHLLISWLQSPPAVILVKVKVRSPSRVWLSVTPWTVAYQALPSTGFSRQESWSGLPFPSPGDLSNPGIEPRSPALWAGTLLSKPPGKPMILEHPPPQTHKKSLSLFPLLTIYLPWSDGTRCHDLSFLNVEL